jgi:hypothetical protein
MLQVAVTFVCVLAMMSGVPVGTQMDWLVFRRTGWPFEVTRVAAVGGMKVAVTHGPLPVAGGGIVQPAIEYCAVATTMGWPPTVTLGETAVGCAVPACEH